MDILWARDSATVAQVTASLADPPLAYNTVLTTMRILEQKGYVKHAAIGRAFVYKPAVGREEVRRSVIAHVVARFFNNSPRELVLNVLESDTIDEAERARLREFIERTGMAGND